MERSLFDAFPISKLVMATSARRPATEFIPPLDLKPAQTFIKGLTSHDSSHLDAEAQKQLCDRFLQALTALGDAFGSSGADKGSMFCRATVEILIDFVVVNSANMNALSESEKEKNNPPYKFIFHTQMRAIEVVGELQGRLTGFDFSWVMEKASQVLAQCGAGLGPDDLSELGCQLRRGIVWDCEEGQSTVYGVVKACVAVILFSAIAATLSPDKRKVIEQIGDVANGLDELVTLTNLLAAFAEEGDADNKDKLLMAANRISVGVAMLNQEVIMSLALVPDVISTGVRQAIAKNLALVPKNGAKIIEPLIKWISNNDVNLLNTEFESLNSGSVADVMYWVEVVVRVIFARKYPVAHIRNSVRMLCEKCVEIEEAMSPIAKADLQRLRNYANGDEDADIGFCALELAANLSLVSPDKMVLPHMAKICKTMFSAFPDEKLPAKTWVCIQRCATVCMWEALSLCMKICRDMYDRLKLATEDMSINEKAKSVPYFTHYLEVVMPMLSFDRNYFFPSQLLPALERTVKVFDKSRTFQNYRFQTEMMEAVPLVKWCGSLVASIASDLSKRSWRGNIADFQAMVAALKKECGGMSNCQISRAVLDICALCKCNTAPLQEQAIHLVSSEKPLDDDERDRLIHDIESLKVEDSSTAPLVVVIDSRLEAQARFLPLLVHAKRCDEIRTANQQRKRSLKERAHRSQDGSDSERIPLLKSSSAILGGVAGDWLSRPGSSLPMAGNVRQVPSVPPETAKRPQPSGVSLTTSAAVFSPLSLQLPTLEGAQEAPQFQFAPVLPPFTLPPAPSKKEE